MPELIWRYLTALLYDRTSASSVALAGSLQTVSHDRSTRMLRADRSEQTLLEREQHDRNLTIYKLKRQLTYQGPTLALPALERLRKPRNLGLLDQAPNAIERKLFAMKGFHHPSGSQQAFLRGLAHLYNLIPYQRRAQYAGQYGIEVEGGRVPTAD
jgi:hypothetical protein